MHMYCSVRAILFYHIMYYKLFTISITITVAFVVDTRNHYFTSKKNQANGGKFAHPVIRIHDVKDDFIVVDVLGFVIRVLEIRRVFGDEAARQIFDDEGRFACSVRSEHRNIQWVRIQASWWWLAGHCQRQKNV